MESPVSFTGHQEAREICLRGGKSGFPDAVPSTAVTGSPLGSPPIMKVTVPLSAYLVLSLGSMLILSIDRYSSGTSSDTTSCQLYTRRI